jgi:hypothetical protein
MGTLNYTLADYGVDNARTLISSRPVTSDAYTSSTSATFVEDGAGDITVGVGQVFRATIDEAAWIAFGDRVATVGNDFYMRPDTEYEWEIAPGDDGKVSIIDVA